MGLFGFFRERKEREEKELARQQYEDYRKKLKSTPHEEMFRALREEGGIRSLKELQESGQLTPEIQKIWDITKEDMFIMSLNHYKIKCLNDADHLYFIPHGKYPSWDIRLQCFFDTLASLSTLNSFAVINSLGTLVFLNPLDEPLDSSHDEEIQRDLDDFIAKLPAVCI